MPYRTTISIVRKLFVCSLFVTVCAVQAQSLYSRQQFLDKITSSAADVQDDLILKRTLYGTLRPDDISLEQSEEMVAAAQRRMDRVKTRIEEIRPMIDQGILARNELTPLVEELDFRRRTFDLAESRARFLREISEMAKAEAAQEPQDDNSGPKPLQERYDGNGRFDSVLLRRVLLAFEKQFGKALPISANGETAFHKSMGFDHRGRVDVALLPDQAEGVWLRQFLEKEQIPYFAFRTAISGKASAAHIHIGPPSGRLRVAD